MATKRVKFSEVPVGSALYCYWDSNNPKDFDTFRAVKVNATTVEAAGQFNALTMHPDEPCKIHVS